jgi:hypothetical protein
MTPVADPATRPRTVQILPLSVRQELANVVRLGVAIVAGVWLYLASAPMDTARAAGSRALLPFQTVASELPETGQRMFRELQEGRLEAENLRSIDGRWPDPATLSAQGVPPFAHDPTSKGSAYSWRLVQQGTIVNYLGVPSDAKSAAWLLLIQEPIPGAPPDPASDDEEHNRLPDGTMLHVSIWKHDDGSSVKMALTPLPEAAGWKQIYGR